MMTSYKQIYILCPYGLVTGGSDALHQLVFYINQVHKDKATLVYCDRKERDLSIPSSYQEYISKYALLEDIPDEKDILLIVPETLYFHLDNYHNLKKYIWWLSIDKNTSQTSTNKIKDIIKKLFSIKTWKRIFSGYYSKEKIKDFKNNTPYDFTSEKDDIIHLCASHYAFDTIKQKSKNETHLLVEPISLYYLKKGPYQKHDERKKQVLYNPVKSGAYVKELSRKRKDISFIPLTGYNQNELLELYRHSLLYVDFGPFPGAERMPKEACYNGCLIITGRNGASNYYEDVLLPDEDKFIVSKENINPVLDRIDAMLNDPDKYYQEEQPYFERISALEANFLKAIEELF